ncbi:hypothetical protein Mapa_006690 [Marchantia paleacea]|nr:hypothetical protein Mapa_006690 [Marchantia paleacea]
MDLYTSAVSLLLMFLAIHSGLPAESWANIPNARVIPRIPRNQSLTNSFSGVNNTAGPKRATLSGISHVLHANSTLLPKDCDERCAGRIQSKRLTELLRPLPRISKKSLLAGYFRVGVVWLNYKKVVNWYVTITVTDSGDEDEHVQEVRVIPDTGSFFTWFQCKPCECYPQRWSIFDPALNPDTFQFVNDPNHDRYCKVLTNSEFGQPSQPGRCSYRAYYLDTSISIGLAARDTFRFQQLGADNHLILDDIAFGCGYRNRLTANTGIGGVLGLGPIHGLLIPEQLSDRMGKSFAFCLPIVGSPENAGWIVFGDDGMPIDMMVGGRAVGVPAGIFDINPGIGEGGLIIESGTGFSTLIPEAYFPFRDAYRASVRPLLGDVKFGGKFEMDSCWDVTYIDVPTLELPTTGYILRNGRTFQLGRIASFFTYYTRSGRPVLCLPFRPHHVLSLLGGYSMQQTHMAFDTPNNRLIWKNGIC